MTEKTRHQQRTIQIIPHRKSHSTTAFARERHSEAACDLRPAPTRTHLCARDTAEEEEDAQLGASPVT